MDPEPKGSLCFFLSENMENFEEIPSAWKGL